MYSYACIHVRDYSIAAKTCISQRIKVCLLVLARVCTLERVTVIAQHTQSKAMHAYGFLLTLF